MFFTEICLLAFPLSLCSYPGLRRPRSLGTTKSLLSMAATAQYLWKPTGLQSLICCNRNHGFGLSQNTTQSLIAVLDGKPEPSPFEASASRACILAQAQVVFAKASKGFG